ncbi:hypothetical protein RhiJN_24145 [Ceratobasidium sp. AG-Ba]|nr:hypothetical protein RhiJN_24145 [Ceratobasidium sp. AG-Ba]
MPISSTPSITMGLPVPDGIYSIQLPHNEACITDCGQGGWLSLLEKGKRGDAHKIEVIYNIDKGAYSLRFEESKKYLTFQGAPSMDNKLFPSDKPRYFIIKPHEYEKDKFAIGVAEHKMFHIATAAEHIYPPVVAMNDMLQKQAWHFVSVY